MGSCKKTLLCVLFVLFLFGCVSQGFAEVGELEARAVLDNVAVFLTSAYRAVAEAEAAGANVTELKIKLNYAGELLAAANASFGVGNFSGAVHFALLANETVEGVEFDASQLAVVARDDWSRRFQWAVLGSSIGASSAVLVVLFVWVRFRRWYVRRVLEFKPEVSKSES